MPSMKNLQRNIFVEMFYPLWSMIECGLTEMQGWREGRSGGEKMNKIIEGAISGVEVEFELFSYRIRAKNFSNRSQKLVSIANWLSRAFFNCNELLNWCWWHIILEIWALWTTNKSCTNVMVSRGEHIADLTGLLFGGFFRRCYLGTAMSCRSLFTNAHFSSKRANRISTIYAVVSAVRLWIFAVGLLHSAGVSKFC